MGNGPINQAAFSQRLSSIPAGRHSCHAATAHPHDSSAHGPSQPSISAHGTRHRLHRKNRNTASSPSEKQEPTAAIGSGPWRPPSQTGRISVSHFTTIEGMPGITPAHRLPQETVALHQLQNLHFVTECDGNRNLSDRMSKIETLYCFTALLTMDTHF